MKIRHYHFGLIFLLIFALTGYIYSLVPAGTVIGNAATATYYDSQNNQYTTTSNIVQTVVKQVAGVDVQAIQDYTAIPGQTVDVPFTVKNTGNGTDTFTLTPQITGQTWNVTLYKDDNGNGVVDPGENQVTSITLGINETANIIARVEVPPSANPGDTATVSLTATSQYDNTVSDTDSSNITLVNDALINASKSADKHNAQPGDTITFTIRIQNVGTREAKSKTYTIDGNPKDGILIKDAIPTGTTFVNGSATGQPSSGTVVYSTDGTTWSTTPTTPVNYVGFFIPDPNPNDGNSEPTLGVDQQAIFTFQVQVNSPFNDTDGTVDNQAVIEYADSNGNPKTTLTNKAIVPVPPTITADVSLGPLGNAEEDSGTNWQDDNTISQAGAGTWVSFKHTVKNNGNTDDTINVAVDTSTLPTGSIVEFWNADETAKLIDTNGDGTPDVGVVSPNQTKDFTVKVYIPDNATGGPYYVDIVAISSNNTNETDKSRDTIQAVLGASVDLAKKGNGGDGDNTNDNITKAEDGTNGINSVVDPGEEATYPLQIVNTGPSPDSFSLNVTGLPTGTSPVFYTDPNCDGNYSDGQQITDTPVIGGTYLTSNANSGDTTIQVNDIANISSGDTLIIGAGSANYEAVTVSSVDVANKAITLSSGLSNNHPAGTKVSESICVVLVVQTTPSTPPADVTLTVTATSPSSGTSDSITAELKINEKPAIAVSPDHSDQLPPGGTTTYQHVVENTGNVPVTVNLEVPSTGTQLTYVILDDSMNPVGTTYNVGTLNPGQSKTFYVKVIAPSSVATGTVETIEVTGKADADGNTATIEAQDSAVDTTTIIEGFLKLTKSVDKTQAAPGEVITYTIKYENIGSEPALNVVITDPIPSYTTYESGSMCLDSNCDGTCDTTLTDGSGDDEGTFTGSEVQFNIGTVNPGQSGCVKFQVRVNN